MQQLQHLKMMVLTCNIGLWICNTSKWHCDSAEHWTRTRVL